MSDLVPEDLKRRIDRLEKMYQDLHDSSHDSLVKLTVHMERFSSLKDGILDIKKIIEKNVEDIQNIKTELGNLNLGFNAVRWVAGAVAGGGIAMILAYLFPIKG